MRPWFSAGVWAHTASGTKTCASNLFSVREQADRARERHKRGSNLFICNLSYYRLYPIIHLLPGINEMSLVATKQLINVHTAITGMAATVGNPNVDLNTDTHKPSQNMCIRNMP